MRGLLAPSLLPLCLLLALPASAEPVATRALRAGTVLAPGDLAAGSAADRAAARRLVGLSLDRSLSAGAKVGLGDVSPPILVERGARVTIEHRRGGLSVAATGRATADAVLGERVVVVNETSRRRVAAIAVAPGRVVAP